MKKAVAKEVATIRSKASKVSVGCTPKPKVVQALANTVIGVENKLESLKEWADNRRNWRMQKREAWKEQQSRQRRKMTR